MGLIGGSIGLRARELGWEVIGWDVASAAREAFARGIVSALAPSFLELATGVDVLVLAGPVDAIVEHLAELERGGGHGPALVMDVGSVKEPVARAGRNVPAFVPTHPLAGAEKSGPASARADLFAGCTWAYDALLHPAAAPGAARFIAALGARPFAVGSAEHDRVVALTSHLPQMLSVALGVRLAEAHPEPALLALCGPGMRSMLRLSRSSYSMWRPLVAANAGSLAQEVRALAAILQRAADALEAGATDAVGGLFARAAASAAALQASDDGSSSAACGIERTDER